MIVQRSQRFTGGGARVWVWAPIAALISLGAAQAAGPPLSAAPAARKESVFDVYHGVRVEDDYRWLENWNDPAVRAWSEAENRRARAFLAALPGRNSTIRRLRALAGKSSARYFDLMYLHGVLFALKFQPPKQQPFLVALSSPDHPSSERVIVDPNRMDPSGTTAIDFYVPSLDAQLVAVSLSRGGSENGSLHIYEVASGKALADVIPRVNKGTAGGAVAWNADGTGFYYTHYPSPGERPAADLDFYQQIYFHKLGTPVSADTYSLGKDFPRIAEIALRSTPDGRYILATVANGDGGQFAHYLLGPGGRWRQITHFSDGVTIAAFGPDDALYLLSKKGAPRGKILRLPLSDPNLSQAATIVPESDDVIESIVPTAHRLYVTDVWGGPSDIRIFDLHGRSLGKVPMRAISGVDQVVRIGGDDILYESQSFLDPSAWFRFSSSASHAQRTALFETAPVSYSDAEAIRAFAVSKDGTKVPMTIIRRKGTKLDGQNPVLLTGYGGFGISLTPRYSYVRRLWLDRGGIWVIANLRGGGEYGETWHEEGMLTKKQNVFDDFAACAEYLIHSGYTNPSKLAIEGGSNGGLLMGAALTQHPQLFRAVVSFVGIYDMLREEATTPNAVFNTTEYGTVKNAADFKALYAYSPYYHVVNGIRYPAVLFFTGANDPRVNPMQSRKMTARLQAATSSGLPILLRTSANSGHIDSSLDEQIEEEADTFAFLWYELGVKAGASPH